MGSYFDALSLFVKISMYTIWYPRSIAGFIFWGMIIHWYSSTFLFYSFNTISINLTYSRRRIWDNYLKIFLYFLDSKMSMILRNIIVLLSRKPTSSIYTKIWLKILIYFTIQNFLASKIALHSSSKVNSLLILDCFAWHHGDILLF